MRPAVILRPPNTPRNRVEAGPVFAPFRAIAPNPEIIVVAVIGIAALGGIAFRWLDLQRWSLWWDEGFTAWASGLSLSQIIPFARSDNQAPLYYLLQHFWGELFGNSEFALRSLSAFFGTLSLPVFYLLAKKVFNNAMAVAVGFWLFAFSMRQIWYSREARAYEAASFFALVALYALVLFLEKRSLGAFVAIVGSSALTLYLHNMMFFYLFALDIVWLIYPSETTRPRRSREMLAANVCIGTLYLPLVVSLLRQVSAVRGNLYWVAKPTVWSVVATLTNTAGFEVAHLALFMKKALFLPWPVFPLLADAWGIMLALLCGALIAAGFWGASPTTRKRNLSFLIYCVLPIFLVFVVGQRMPLYIDRVFVPSSIAVPIVFAFPLEAQMGRFGKRLSSILAMAIAAVTALSSLGFVRSDEKRAKAGEDWRAVIAAVLTVPETNRLILFVPPAGEIFFDYYSRNYPTLERRVAHTGLQEGFHDRFPPPKSRIINEDDIDHLRKVIESRHYSEIDLVLTHDVDPRGFLVHYLAQRFVEQHDLAPVGPIKVLPFRAVPRP